MPPKQPAPAAPYSWCGGARPLWVLGMLAADGGGAVGLLAARLVEQGEAHVLQGEGKHRGQQGREDKAGAASAGQGVVPS
jgi:hypothetical protein